MTTTGERANPFGDLADFSPSPQPKKPVQAAEIESIAESNGFPSRQAQKPNRPAESSPKGRQGAASPKAAKQRPVRRYTTGRNRQLNLKASDETIDAFYRIADERGVPLAELFEQAVAALEATGTASRTK